MAAKPYSILPDFSSAKILTHFPFSSLPLIISAPAFRKTITYPTYHSFFVYRFVSIMVGMLSFASLLYWLFVDTDSVFKDCSNDNCSKCAPHSPAYHLTAPDLT
jgi:hypothetical protein